MTGIEANASHCTFPKPPKKDKGNGYKPYGSTLTTYTPLRAKTGLNRTGKMGRGKVLKTRSQPKERRDAKLESKERSGWVCLACGREHPEGSSELDAHHIIPLGAHCGEDVPENLTPLCRYPCHLGDNGIHRPDRKDGVTHELIYENAKVSRPDIAAYMEEHIHDWAKHCNPDLADQLISQLKNREERMKC